MGNSNGTAAEPATETSPLLGSDREATAAEAPNPIPGAGSGANDSGSGATAGEVEAESRSAGNGVHEDRREGIPEMIAKLPLLVPALGIGIFLSALDQLLVVATYAKIGNDLEALNSTSWIATAYYLTLTSIQPLYGRLSDIFGRKQCLLFAYAVFGIGCLGCGLAQSMAQLIAARAVAGVGGGGINALVSILMTDIVPLRDRGVWQGYLNIIFAAGMATGSPLGGLLADSVGWRWSFLGQVPLCATAFAAVAVVLHMPPTDHAHWREKVLRIDFLGAFFLVSAVLCLLIGLDGGSNVGWDNTLLVIVPLAVSPVLAVLFVLVEMKVASHPFAPGHVIFERTLSACFFLNLLGCAAQMPVLFFLPLFFQAVDGYTAVQSGALLIPVSIVATVASIGAGLYIKRTGYYYWLTLSLAICLVVGGILLIMFSGAVVKSTIGIMIGMSIAAWGHGGYTTSSLIALIANAAQADSAVVIACSYLFRSLGSSIGISTQSAVLQQALRMRLAARLGDSDAAADIEQHVRQSLDYIAELPPDVARVVRACYQDGITVVFTTCTVLAALAVIAAALIREKRIVK